MNFAKDLKYFDGYDLGFTKTFAHFQETKIQLRDELYEWLNQRFDQMLSEEQKKKAPQYSMEELWEELKKRLEEQTEKHDGGKKWIGTGGTSPFGNSGYNPNGIRMGGEEGAGNRTGISEWTERNYKAYREDQILDTRSIQMALKELRNLKKEGKKDLHIEKTIRKTCENAGEIEFVEERERKNSLRLVLVMDIGGSMTIHSDRVSTLFSASKSIYHFKEVHNFFFHNIFHDYLYTDHDFSNRITLDHFKEKFRKNTKIIFVGDAYMAPYELFSAPYNPYAYHRESEEERKKKRKSGLDSLKELTDVFQDSVWLNPEPKHFWSAPTIDAIHTVVPMFPLSVEGIRQAVRSLLGK
ncbi:hypothetical protein LPTSP4_06440 [Leptospira ryugenii]|uniref:VWA containing CoxE family protein n=2 Tax=Leptospira ryugenii TaxID=1917863 RepID=A0A2P2DWX5_9LEPT|nr:hypothetical protein LPTSP4_06440 [Leptospira ryugenii]